LTSQLRIALAPSGSGARERPSRTYAVSVTGSPDESGIAVARECDAFPEPRLPSLAGWDELGLLEPPGGSAVKDPDRSPAFVVARPSDQGGIAVTSQCHAPGAVGIAAFIGRVELGLLMERSRFGRLGESAGREGEDPDR
jgi:hypothetical protein